MLRAGLAERIPDPDGGMARKLCITPEGRGRLRADRDRFVHCLADVLADWSPAERTSLAGALRHFNTSVERREGRPWPRPTPENAGDA